MKKLGVLILDEEITVIDLVNKINEELNTGESMSIDIEDWNQYNIIELLIFLCTEYKLKFIHDQYTYSNMLCININKTNDESISLSIGPSVHTSSYISKIKIIPNKESKECNNE